MCCNRAPPCRFERESLVERDHFVAAGFSHRRLHFGSILALMGTQALDFLGRESPVRLGGVDCGRMWPRWWGLVCEGNSIPVPLIDNDQQSIH